MKHEVSKLLEELDISAAECAATIELAPSALHRIIVQGQTPNLQTASRIVAATNGRITYDDLLSTEVRRTNRRFKGLLAA